MERRRMILIVADDDSTRNDLAQSLRCEGYGVHETAGAADALAWLGAHEAQMVISDRQLPGMSGLEFLKQARDLRPYCCRLLLMPYGDKHDEAAAPDRGTVYRLVPKPWNHRDLTVTLQVAFELQDIESDNRRVLESLHRQRDARRAL